MLQEAVKELLSGDVDAGKTILRDLINATISFENLAADLHKNSKSIQRMPSTSGDPTSKSLFAIIHSLQQHEKIKLKVSIDK